MTESSWALSQADDDSDQPRIRFADDSDLTFVNYNTNSSVRRGFGYRREARIHNARRRTVKPINPTSSAEVPALTSTTPTTVLVDPLTTFARDPFCQDVLTSPQHLESIWRSIFPTYFHLPTLHGLTLTVPTPADSFLVAARQSRDIYRSIVVQAVVTSEANLGRQADEAVLRNQALILRDFRKLVDLYGNNAVHLSSQQFQHIFASAFALSGNAFDKEAGYSATTLIVTLMMAAPQNQTVEQTAVSDWMQMIMPRPGPSSNRSEDIQKLRLSKVHAVLDFLQRLQAGLHTRFSAKVASYMNVGTSIYKILTLDLSAHISDGPYPDFYLVCFHRILALLHSHFEAAEQTASSSSVDILHNIETFASTCLQLPPQQCVALFAWCLISSSRTIGLGQQQHGPFFTWAMKDLLLVHKITFIFEMAAWLLHKCNPERYPEVPLMDTDGIRLKVQSFYSPDRLV